MAHTPVSCKEVFARFAFTPQVEAETIRLAEVYLADRRGREGTQRLPPRIDALRSAPEFREGLGMALRDVADGYRCYEHMVFCELVPGFKERYAAWVAADPERRPPDVLAPEELPAAERYLFCAMALARELHKAFYPYHAQTHVPFAEFREAVRRAFVTQGYGTMTSDTPRA